MPGMHLCQKQPCSGVRSRTSPTRRRGGVVVPPPSLLRVWRCKHQQLSPTAACTRLRVVRDLPHTSQDFSAITLFMSVIELLIFVFFVCNKVSLLQLLCVPLAKQPFINKWNLCWFWYRRGYFDSTRRYVVSTNPQTILIRPIRYP